MPMWTVLGLSDEVPDEVPVPVHESTREDEVDRSLVSTPPPPDLSRYSPRPSAPRKGKGTRVVRPTRPGPSGRSSTQATQPRQPATSRQSVRQSREGLKRPLQPPTPDEVGTVHSSSHHGGTRVDRLIQDARDPPGLCFEGKTNQLKTIRQRIFGGQLPFERVSTTWHWVKKDGESDSKILVVFKDKKDRDFFQKSFYVGSSGVRVFHCSLAGL
ncbi:E4 [Serinus canaria papillomavirus 1]|nr:E4 [Serinus canaria papillomavirus 1]AVH76293.1 E4 [Serinus canaria papillomavirus 1]